VALDEPTYGLERRSATGLFLLDHLAARKGMPILALDEGGRAEAAGRRCAPATARSAP
jgi:hypothetical protein